MTLLNLSTAVYVKSEFGLFGMTLPVTNFDKRSVKVVFPPFDSPYSMPVVGNKRMFSRLFLATSLNYGIKMLAKYQFINLK